MKKIDAHAHLGYIGGWANVKMDADELISLMVHMKLKRQ